MNNVVTTQDGRFWWIPGSGQTFQCVQKISGDYSFPSLVIGIVGKITGKELLICETYADGVQGMVHIFSPEVMEPVTTPQGIPVVGFKEGDKLLRGPKP